jgi:hypothetical protein
MNWLADYRDFWEESYQRLDTLLAELEPHGPASSGGRTA